MRKHDYVLGQTVWHKTNHENVGIVTGIMLRPIGVLYYVTFSDLEERSCFGNEITETKPESEDYSKSE